ncbi:hypothetical protein BSKO_03114 [Bryopsis sp. KO-2023]|nr:hypothetical protein BSKO_03114 [Bryopsis sp. KO-2023]
MSISTRFYLLALVAFAYLLAPTIGQETAGDGAAPVSEEDVVAGLDPDMTGETGGVIVPESEGGAAATGDVAPGTGSHSVATMTPLFAALLLISQLMAAVLV